MIGILGRSSTEGTMRWLMLSLSGREWRVAIRLDESGMDKEAFLPSANQLQLVLNPTTSKGGELLIAGARSQKSVRSWVESESEIGLWIRSEGAAHTEGWDIVVPRLCLHTESD